MRTTRATFRRAVLLCSLLAMILVSGCATFITTSTATQVDRWNRTIEPVPLDQLLTLHKGDHLLITLQDETELEGKLQSIRLDTSLVVRSGSWILGHQNQTIHRSDLMYVRLIQQPIRRRMTGVILGLPVDAVGAYYGFVFSALVILIITFIFNGPGTV